MNDTNDLMQEDLQNQSKEVAEAEETTEVVATEEITEVEETAEVVATEETIEVEENAIPTEEAEEPAPATEKKPRYNKKRILIYSILAGLAFTIGVALITLSVWYKNTFDLGFKHLLYNLAAPVEGTGSATIVQILSACLPWILLGIATYVVTAVIISRGTGLFQRMRRVGAVLCVLVMLCSFPVTLFSFGIPEYLASLGEQTTLYEEYYVDPATVPITAKGKTKNLIYIVLESMESEYATKEDGGLQDSINYIPNLTQLAKDNISFSDKGDGKIGGFYTFGGVTSWTMGALFALTSGLPFNFPVSENEMGNQEYFAPGITNLGDILEDHGYNSVFICGSDAKFGGRKNYFTQHGNYAIYDLYTARANGDLPTKNYYKFWGFEDKYLYNIAKNEATRLAAEGEPFNLTFLTVDTHFPNGCVCSECDNTYKADMENILLCADHQVMEFVNWCKEQDFYEDTVIIISGDHPFMGKDLAMIQGKPMNDRPVYNCIINSAIEAPKGTTSNRLFTSMDMFPTTLAAMGFEITGNRLAMGVNLFSGNQTIIEHVGYDVFAEEVVKDSDYYNEFTGFNKANETT